MPRPSATLTPFGVKKLNDKLELLKQRYVDISHDLKDKTQSHSILAIKRIEHEIIAVDILNMERVLASAHVIEKDLCPFKIAQGTTVIYAEHATASQNEVTLVDPLEADPSEGFISIKSPIGAALLGHMAEDTVYITTPKGINQLKIIRLA
jgi:transcription elongation factor GreA